MMIKLQNYKIINYKIIIYNFLKIVKIIKLDVVTI